MLPDIYGLEAHPVARLRPMGVTLIATLVGLEGFVMTLSGLARLIAWLMGRLQPPNVSGPTMLAFQLFGGFALLLWLLIGLSLLAVSIGMLHLRNWARVVCLVLQALIGGIQLLLALIAGLRGGMAAAAPALLSGLVALCIIVYLLRSPIRAAFFRANSVAIPQGI